MNPKQLTILIADDSPAIREQIKKILSCRPYKLLEAIDGVEALEIVEKLKPEIVLMDVQMPRLDGIECAKQIKSHPMWKKTRIIMVTGEDGFDKKSEAYKIGVNEYITKPISDGALLASLDKVVRFIQIVNTAKSTMKRLPLDDFTDNDKGEDST